MIEERELGKGERESTGREGRRKVKNKIKKERSERKKRMSRKKTDNKVM